MSQRSDDEALKAMEKAAREPWDEVEGKEEKLKLLYKKIGQVQAFNLIQLMSRLAVTKIVKEIHESKLYKIETSEFEEFCQKHFGVGRQFFYDGFKILQSLGMDFCRYGDNIGLTFGDIRRIARLKDKNFVCPGDKIITIEGTSYELIPENKEEIQEVIAELSTRVQAEKRRADGYERMAKNRADKTAKLEKELEHIKNPNPNKTQIESLMEEIKGKITVGLAQFEGTARMILKKEKETGERASERSRFMGLLGEIKLSLTEAIANIEREFGELSELEIRQGFKEMGMPLPEKEPEQ